MELEIISPKDLAEYVGSHDAALSLLQEFHADLSGSILEVINEIKTAAESADMNKLREKSHYIKGMAANMTARRFSDVAHKIEMAAKEELLENMPALVDELLMEYQTLKEYMQNFFS